MSKQGLFSKLGNIIRGKAHSLVDSIESMEDSINNEIRELKNKYDKAVRESAPYRGLKTQKEKEISELKNQIATLEQGIRNALAKEDKAFATKYLTEVKKLQQKLALKEQELEEIKSNTENIEAKLKALNNQIIELENKKQELLARAASADATASINELIGDLNIGSSNTINEFEKKIIEKENYSRGLNSMSEKEDDDFDKYLSPAPMNELDLDAELEKYRIVGTLSFSKTDFTSGEIVPGATIKIEGISNHNKDFVAEFISSVDGNRIELEYGKYKITEIIAPEGYVKTEETGEFEIKQDGEIVKAELKNKRITGSLNILKIDSNTKEALSGAIFGVYNKDMELIEKLTSDSKGLASIETLYYGDYIIKELEAPNGYTAIKENIEFSIKEDGQIVDITIKNDKVKVLSQNLPFAGGLNTGLILAISTITALASLKILKKK